MYRQGVTEELPKSQFDAARLGFFQLLRRKRMSPQFIERHGEDLFAQACFEYSRQLADGKRIDNPVAWIITCGWHRTVGLLESRDWRPRVVSTERIGEQAAEDGDAPEEALLSEDRYRKVREAVERLPAYQRQLLALSYFEDESVREAARRLEWTPSKGQRAHEAAQRRLHKLLGVETSDELAIEVGLAAFLSLGGGGCSLRLQLIGGVEGAVDGVTHGAAQLGERAFDLIRRPFGSGEAASTAHDRLGAAGELGRRVIGSGGHGQLGLAARTGRRASEAGRRLLAGNALETAGAAAEGGGRAAEVCKAAIAVCLIGGAAITGVELAPAHHHHPRHPQAGKWPAGSAASRSAPLAERPSEGSEEATSGAPATESAPTSAADAQAEGGSPASAAKSAAQRRAVRHKSEEADAEARFAGVVVAGNEAGASGHGSDGYASSAGTGTAAGSSSSGGESSGGGSGGSGAAESAEESSVRNQVRGGLPGLR